MSLDLCLKQLHVVHIKVFLRMQYIGLLLFYSVIFQSVIFRSVLFQSCKFHPCDFVRHFPVLQIQLSLKITEHIEYKLLSPTDKVLTTILPPYLHNLISVQRPRSTRSSSAVTLARLYPGINSICLFVNLFTYQLLYS